VAFVGVVVVGGKACEVLSVDVLLPPSRVEDGDAVEGMVLFGVDLRSVPFAYVRTGCNGTGSSSLSSNAVTAPSPSSVLSPSTPLPVFRTLFFLTVFFLSGGREMTPCTITRDTQWTLVFLFPSQ